MRFAVVFGLALVCGCSASVPPAPTPVPSITEFVIPTASPKPSPTAYTGHYGVLVWDAAGYIVRREDGGTSLGTIDLDPIAVAPDGRYVAGWKNGNELQIRDVHAPSVVVRSTRLPAGESGTFVVWSVDESGLLFSVQGSSWSALRTLEVTTASATPKEVLRYDAVTLRPAEWDRLGGDLVAAFITGGGSATEYVIVRGTDAPLRRPLPPGKRWQEAPAVSGDGQFIVLASQSEPLVRTFNADDPGFVVETHGQNATTGAAAIGRPATGQLGVLLDREFYLWDPTGPRDPFSTEPIFGLVCFRFDGSAAVVRTASGLKLLDVKTKTLAPLEGDVRYGVALP